MSVRLMAMVMSDPYYTEKNRTEYGVALMIADSARDNGKCYPAVETIARKARVSVRTAQRAIAQLVADRKLVRLFRKKEDSRESDTSLYRFTYEPGGDTVTPPGDTVSPGGDMSPGGGGDTGVTQTIKNHVPPLPPFGGEETAVRPKSDYLPLFDRKKKAAENGEWTEALMKAGRIEYPDAIWPKKFTDLPVDIQHRIRMRMKVMMAV